MSSMSRRHLMFAATGIAAVAAAPSVHRRDPVRVPVDGSQLHRGSVTDIDVRDYARLLDISGQNTFIIVAHEPAGTTTTSEPSVSS